MKYNCIIIDDNEIERDALEMHLKKIPALQIVAICADAMEAMLVLNTHTVDIVFSDIDMPEISGFDLLKSTVQKPVFIFITSFSQYAVDGFNLDALDFIVKPATFERLFKAVNKAIEYIEIKKIAQQADLSKIDTQADDFFYFKETKGLTKLYYHEVFYIESMGDFSKIHTHKGMHIILVNLKNLEIQLPDSTFLRVHKQFMINTQHISTLSNHEIHLTNDFVVPISSALRQQLLDQINKKTVNRFIR